MDDGDYIVFLEADRSPKIPEQITELMEDLMNLTEQDLSEWRMRYRTSPEQEFSIDNLTASIPLTSEDYQRKYGEKELDEMRIAAGINVNSKAPINDYTQSIRSLAGII